MPLESYTVRISVIPALVGPDVMHSTPTLCVHFERTRHTVLVPVSEISYLAILHGVSADVSARVFDENTVQTSDVEG